jgi:ribosomal protein S17
MTLTEKINSNSYLKVSNCTDIADLEYGMDELRKLDAEFGEDNKTLLKLWAKFLDKKKKMEAKASASNCEHNATYSVGDLVECLKCRVNNKSNMHPIFEQALKPFGIR